MSKATTLAFEGQKHIGGSPAIQHVARQTCCVRWAQGPRTLLRENSLGSINPRGNLAMSKPVCLPTFAGTLFDRSAWSRD